MDPEQKKITAISEASKVKNAPARKMSKEL